MYAVATAAVVAFVVSDIYNGQVGAQSYHAFVPVFILCVPPLFTLALRFYFEKGTTDEVKLESHTDKEVTGAGMVANNVSLTAKADVALCARSAYSNFWFSVSFAQAVATPRVTLLLFLLVLLSAARRSLLKSR